MWVLKYINREPKIAVKMLAFSTNINYGDLKVFYPPVTS